MAGAANRDWRVSLGEYSPQLSFTFANYLGKSLELDCACRINEILNSCDRL